MRVKVAPGCSWYGYEAGQVIDVARSSQARWPDVLIPVDEVVMGTQANRLAHAGRPELDKLTAAQLRELGSQRGIKGAKGMRRAELLAALVADEPESASEEAEAPAAPVETPAPDPAPPGAPPQGTAGMPAEAPPPAEG